MIEVPVTSSKCWEKVIFITKNNKTLFTPSKLAGSSPWSSPGLSDFSLLIEQNDWFASKVSDELVVVSDYAATVGKTMKHFWLLSYCDFSEVSKLIARGKGEVLKFRLYERIKEKFKSIRAVMDTYLVKLIISRSVFKKNTPSHSLISNSKHEDSFS